MAFRFAASPVLSDRSAFARARVVYQARRRNVTRGVSISSRWFLSVSGLKWSSGTPSRKYLFLFSLTRFDTNYWLDVKISHENWSFLHFLPGTLLEDINVVWPDPPPRVRVPKMRPVTLPTSYPPASPQDSDSTDSTTICRGCVMSICSLFFWGH